MLTEQYEVVDLYTMLGSSSPNRKRVAITFDDGYRDFYTEALPILREFGTPATVFVVTGPVLGRVSAAEALVVPPGEPVPKVLMPEQIEALGDEDLITVGSHTRTHPDLRALSNDDLRGEIIGSKTDLRRQFGIETDQFCLPGGKYDERVVDWVGEAYDTAVTVDRGTVRPGVTDPLLVPRIDGARSPAVVRWELTDLADRLRRLIGSASGALD
jgi:peptidoglycan/xylan/chitin deacetylase (PgdA/CDA1 family)